MIGNKKRLVCLHRMNLHRFLETLQIHNVCVMGIHMNTCVLNRAIQASNCDFHVVVPSDRVASL